MEMMIRVLVGAFIGYLTNYLAIKMIFRPNREYRLFGRRVPFTPGLIYMRKSELAGNIGMIVENDLLNKEKLKDITGSRIRHYLKKRGLEDKSLFSFFNAISDNILEKLIRNINIGKIVNDEIMALDMKKLEEMILRISKKEFRYIQYVGAIIGGMIGFSQSIINL